MRSVGDAQTLFDEWRGAEYGWVRAQIIAIAWMHGEFHADYLGDAELDQPNIIGAAVNALATGKLLEKLNAAGEVEHRRGSSPAAHGRASYVWRLTEKGQEVATALLDRIQAKHRQEVENGAQTSLLAGEGSVWNC